MQIVRKTLKINIMGIVFFTVMSFIVAAIIYFTDIGESWFPYIIYVVLGGSSLLVGVVESKIVSQRRFVAALVECLMFLLLTVGIIKLIFP